MGRRGSLLARVGGSVVARMSCALDTCAIATKLQAVLMQPLGETRSAADPQTALLALQNSAAAGDVPAMLLFWGHTPHGTEPVGPWVLSQWWRAPFAVEGETFATAEHFMMAGKAALFGDEPIRKAILADGDPKVAKALGRKVAGYDEARWAATRYDLVVRGNLAKFSQHASLREFLVSTGERVLVEASPFDRVWGIGLGASHPRAHDPRTWKGQNLLGFALMETRARLRGD